MFETTQIIESNNLRQVLDYKKNSRMAGSIAVWKKQTITNSNIIQNLSYATGKQISVKYKEDNFSFADLLDMVNPLQHIPLINTLYQDITGDKIKPASQIVGGAIFGGIAGAGSALVNVVVKEATGQNIVDNVLSIVKGKDISVNNAVSDHPEARLNKAVHSIADNKADNSDLPVSVMSFIDISIGKQIIYEKFSMDEERTAGSMTRISTRLLIEKPAREPITQLKLSPWPKYND